MLFKYEEIYSINHHSLKDAIVQFNGGCTAEIVSKDGLVLTNHHCGYDAIAELSTADNNLLKKTDIGQKTERQKSIRRQACSFVFSFVWMMSLKEF